MEGFPESWCVIYDSPERFNIIDAESYEHAQALLCMLPSRYHIPSSQLHIVQEKDIDHARLQKLHGEMQHVIIAGVAKYQYTHENGTIERYHGPIIKPDPDYPS